MQSQASFAGILFSILEILCCYFAQIKALGSTDVVFHKRCGLKVEDMASSTRVYKKLRAFRAGIEGTISFLKRVFGLERCTWCGFDSFKSYVQASVLSCNLLVIARKLLAATA
jgi:IS5 family transposase